MVEEPGEVGSGGAIPPPCPAGDLLEGGARPPGVMAVALPAGEQVLVSGPRHSSGGESPAEFFPPYVQPGEAEPGQGGIVFPPPGPTYGGHRHPLAPFNSSRLL